MNSRGQTVPVSSVSFRWLLKSKGLSKDHLLPMTFEMSMIIPLLPLMI